MKIIGIVGGIASGKSEVTRRLTELGACRLDADQAGHAALQDPGVQAALRERWGDAVFHPDGTVDRAAVARRVFGSPEFPDKGQVDANRRFLEQLTHPLIEQKLVSEIERCRNERRAEVAVVDAALLFEAGWDRQCDQILFVDAPESERMQRALQRGWTPDHFRAREATQLAVAEKRRRATVMIDNSGTREALRAQVDAWWREQVERHHKSLDSLPHPELPS